MRAGDPAAHYPFGFASQEFVSRQANANLFTSDLWSLALRRQELPPVVEESSVSEWKVAVGSVWEERGNQKCHDFKVAHAPAVRSNPGVAEVELNSHTQKQARVREYGGL